MIGSGRPVSSIPAQVGIRSLGPEVLQVRVVHREAVVLGAGGELDLLGEQVEHPAALAGRVIARGSRMAVKVGAEPAAGLDRTLSLAARGVSLARSTLIVVNTASYSGPWLTITSYSPGSSSTETRRWRCTASSHAVDGGIGPEIWAGRPFATRDLHFAGDRLAVYVRQLGHDVARGRQFNLALIALDSDKLIDVSPRPWAAATAL